MDANRFNEILVLDSIPAGELNTARRLEEDLKSLAFAHAPSPRITYLRAETVGHFIQALVDATERAANEGRFPLLHIECHGDEDGFQLADGSYLDWEEIRLPVTELNVATRLNLLIAIAACEGAALAKSVRLSDRAPFWGLIGPTQSLTPNALLSAYGAFYFTLLESKSPGAAIKAMESAAAKGSFWRTTAQHVFEYAWSSYKADHCTPAAWAMRIQRMMAQLPSNTTLTPQELMQQMKNSEPGTFERFRRCFFMCDLYPTNDERFPVQYPGWAAGNVPTSLPGLPS